MDLNEFMDASATELVEDEVTTSQAAELVADAANDDVPTSYIECDEYRGDHCERAENTGSKGSEQTGPSAGSDADEIDLDDIALRYQILGFIDGDRG